MCRVAEAKRLGMYDGCALSRHVVMQYPGCVHSFPKIASMVKNTPPALTVERGKLNEFVFIRKPYR